MENVIRSIPMFKDASKMELIRDGWSQDIKYRVDDRYLVRFGSADRYDRKKREYDIMNKISDPTVNMISAVDFGLAGSMSYIVTTWLEGQPLEEYLRQVNDNEAFVLGIEAGKALKILQRFEAEEKVDYLTLEEKMMATLENYQLSGARIAGDDNILGYVYDHMDLLRTKPLVYTHGDFHVGNLLMTVDGVGVIDFNRAGIDHPYRPFYKLELFDVDVSPSFACGRIRGYFEGEVPLEFWACYAFFVAFGCLSALAWSEAVEDFDGLFAMKKRVRRIVRDFEDFQTEVPLWYRNISNKIGE